MIYCILKYVKYWLSYVRLKISKLTFARDWIMAQYTNHSLPLLSEILLKLSKGKIIFFNYSLQESISVLLIFICSKQCNKGLCFFGPKVIMHWSGSLCFFPSSIIFLISTSDLMTGNCLAYLLKCIQSLKFKKKMCLQ